jgi:uncharacterized protein (DUF3084 family)
MDEIQKYDEEINKKASKVEFLTEEIARKTQEIIKLSLEIGGLKTAKALAEQVNKNQKEQGENNGKS